MQSDPEINESLRKILVIKRYELPPPGYFNHLPDRIMARLYAEIERERLPWFQRWWLAVESKPAFAGIFGVAMCGILVGGVVYSENPEISETVSAPFHQPFPLFSASQPSSAEWEEPGSLWQEPEADGIRSLALDSSSSTNPLVESQLGEGLFQYQGFATPVSFGN